MRDTYFKNNYIYCLKNGKKFMFKLTGKNREDLEECFKDTQSFTRDIVYCQTAEAKRIRNTAKFGDLSVLSAEEQNAFGYFYVTTTPNANIYMCTENSPFEHPFLGCVSLMVRTLTQSYRLTLTDSAWYSYEDMIHGLVREVQKGGGA